MDLLDATLQADYSVRPQIFRERVLAERPSLVIIDEIQSAPNLLPQVHWLLENTRTQLILCGSSARKLRRGADNLLGGRAVEHALLPLTSREIDGMALDKYLRHGGLPTHYLLADPTALMRSYVSTYIKQEIIDDLVSDNYFSPEGGLRPSHRAPVPGSRPDALGARYGGARLADA